VPWQILSDLSKLHPRSRGYTLCGPSRAAVPPYLIPWSEARVSKFRCAHGPRSYNVILSRVCSLARTECNEGLPVTCMRGAFYWRLCVESSVNQHRNCLVILPTQATLPINAILDESSDVIRRSVSKGFNSTSTPSM